MDLTIYLACSISGQNTDNIENYYLQTESILTKLGYNIFHCYQAKNGIKPNTIMSKQELFHDPTLSDTAILYRDNWMVRKADIIFANLLNTKNVSIGSVAELAWAWDHHKHIVLCMQEDSMHNHAFIRAMSPIRYNTFDKCINYLTDFITNA